VLFPRPTTASWTNAANCNLCHELLRHVRTCWDWWQTHPTQWTKTTIPIFTLFEQTSYVVNFLSHLYFNIWTALFIWPLKLWFVVLCSLKELCICQLKGSYHHFTFCHNDIVHSLQLCSVEMHSFAHFDSGVAFDDVSEIQFFMFYWMVKFFTGFSKYRWNFVSYGRKYRHTSKRLLKCLKAEVAALCCVLCWCDILEEVPSRFKILAEISKIGHTCKQWMAMYEISSLVAWFHKRCNFIIRVYKMLHYLTSQSHLTFLRDHRLEYLAWKSTKSCLSSLCCHNNALIRVYIFYQHIRNVHKWMNFFGWDLGSMLMWFKVILGSSLLFMHSAINQFFATSPNWSFISNNEVHLPSVIYLL